MGDERTALPNQTIAQVGIEIWRLRTRLDGQADPDRLRDSADRLLRAFEELGARVEDRSGTAFVDGMVVEVLDQPVGVDPGAGTLIWAETVRPGIYIGDKCVVLPQVVLTQAVEASGDDPKAHD